MVLPIQLVANSELVSQQDALINHRLDQVLGLIPFARWVTQDNCSYELAVFSASWAQSVKVFVNRFSLSNHNPEFEWVRPIMQTTFRRDEGDDEE